MHTRDGTREQIAKANSLFQKRFKGTPNFMTPDIIGRGMTKSGRFAWELSEGTGISRQPIYGVTVIHAQTMEVSHDLSKMFQSKIDARDHIEELD